MVGRVDLFMSHLTAEPWYGPLTFTCVETLQYSCSIFTGLQKKRLEDVVHLLTLIIVHFKTSLQWSTRTAHKSYTLWSNTVRIEDVSCDVFLLFSGILVWYWYNTVLLNIHPGTQWFLLYVFVLFISMVSTSKIINNLTSVFHVYILFYFIW